MREPDHCTKWLRFSVYDQKPKTTVFTAVWVIYGLRSDTYLGMIKWYPPWRQYCFFSCENTVFNSECLDDINAFVQDANQKHKQKRAANG